MKRKYVRPKNSLVKLKPRWEWERFSKVLYNALCVYHRLLNKDLE